MKLPYNTLEWEQRGPLLLLTLNRPRVLNAYTPEMGEDLVVALRRAAEQEDIRAVALTGAGRGFCAGADRGCLAGAIGPSGLRLGEEALVRDFVLELAELPMLTMVAFNGVAAGIGVTMSLGFDLRLAVPEASFRLNFARLGILPGLGVSHFLPRLIGPGQAARLLLCERKLDAVEALEMGLVEELHPAEELLPRLDALAHSVAECPPEVVAAIKRCLRRGMGSSLAEAMDEEQRNVRKLRMQRDREGADG